MVSVVYDMTSTSFMFVSLILYVVQLVTTVNDMTSSIFMMSTLLVHVQVINYEEI